MISGIPRRKELKSLARKAYLSGNKTLAFQYRQQLSGEKRIYAPSFYRRVCNITGRSRGVFRQFGISRQEIRRLMSRGEIFGVFKAS
jgi:small subunit ribosomal protein S14